MKSYARRHLEWLGWFVMYNVTNHLRPSRHSEAISLGFFHLFEFHGGLFPLGCGDSNLVDNAG